MARSLVLVVLCIGASAGRMQAQKQLATPGEVARVFFEDVAAERWREAASYLDLDGFDRYRMQVINNYRRPQPASTWTADSLMKHQPDMPRAAAEYQISQMKKFAMDTNSAMRFEFADVGSVSELASMSALDAAARMLQAGDIRYKIRLSSEMARCVPPYRKAIPQIEVEPDEILGTIVNDSVAYVLHKEGMMRVDSASRARATRRALHLAPEDDYGFSFPPLVMVLRKKGDRWVIGTGFQILSRENEAVVGCTGIP